MPQSRARNGTEPTQIRQRIDPRINPESFQNHHQIIQHRESTENGNGFIEGCGNDRGMLGMMVLESCQVEAFGLYVGVSFVRCPGYGGPGIHPG